jgi:hypothetical protein
MFSATDRVREQRVVLEHHADPALLRRAVQSAGGIGQQFAADADAPLGAAFQPRHRAQQRGLAAARGPDEHADLARRQAEADRVDGRPRFGWPVAHADRFDAQEHVPMISAQTE